MKGLTASNLSTTLSVAVNSRISRHSYGTLMNEYPFDETEHHRHDKYYDPILREYVAIDQTKWFLHIVGNPFYPFNYVIPADKICVER